MQTKNKKTENANARKALRPNKYADNHMKTSTISAQSIKKIKEKSGLECFAFTKDSSCRMMFLQELLSKCHGFLYNHQLAYQF